MRLFSRTILDSKLIFDVGPPETWLPFDIKDLKPVTAVCCQCGKYDLLFGPGGSVIEYSNDPALQGRHTAEKCETGTANGAPK